jgi:hypothetical protein
MASLQQTRDKATVARWDAAIAQRVKAGATQRDAIRALVREDPQLHTEYLGAFNREHARTVAANEGRPYVE